MAVVAIPRPAPWYAHQLARYDSALFGQPAPESLSGRAVPLGFFVGPGLPQVVTEPYRPSFSHRFAPVAYTETWGDYFGVWRWFPSRGRPSADVRRELVTMSIVGLPFTLVAVAGWFALLGLAVRHPGARPERQLVALLPLGALAGILYFATAYPTPDGDTVKGSFMLTAVPAWAACFGFAFDGLRARFARFAPVLVGALAVLAAVAVPFLLAGAGAVTERAPSDEWRYLRVAFAIVGCLVVAEPAGWIVYRSVHEGPTALELTERCLRREKLLQTERREATRSRARQVAARSRRASRITASRS